MSVNTPQIETIFQQDEMKVLVVNPSWSHDQLLAQEGMVFLKDVAHILGITSLDVKKQVHQILARGQNPYKIMGVRKIWNHWFMRLETFGPYYQRHLAILFQRVEPSWDTNTLLEKEGIFQLAEVVKLLPFASHQLRYRVKRNPRSKWEYGIWKEQHYYLVNMVVFAPWIRSQWSTLQTKTGTRQLQTRETQTQI